MFTNRIIISNGDSVVRGMQTPDIANLQKLLLTANNEGGQAD